MKTACYLFALLTGASCGALASPIQINFSAPDQTADPGQTLQFIGVITNSTDDSDPIYLNSDSFTFNLDDGDYTLTDNFSNVPVSLSAGQSSAPLDCFDITLATTLAPGTYIGDYGLIGGEDGGAETGNDNLGQASFSITVDSIVLPTPEPGTTALLALGLFMLAVRARSLRRRCASARSTLPPKLDKARQTSRRRGMSCFVYYRHAALIAFSKQAVE